MANNFKRKMSSNVGTTLTSVGSYNVAIGTQTTVIGLTVANKVTSQILIDAAVHDGSNTIYLIKEAPVPVGGSIVIVGGDQKVVLEANDSVRIKSDTANSADVVMSILEIT